MLAFIRVFLRPIYSPIYLYCSPVYIVVILMLYLTKSGKWPLLYYSSFLCVLHFNIVFLLCRCSPLLFDAFHSVLVCNPDFIFSQSIYEFRTAVYYCCLYIPHLRIFRQGLLHDVVFFSLWWKKKLLLAETTQTSFVCFRRKKSIWINTMKNCSILLLEIYLW